MIFKSPIKRRTSALKKFGEDESGAAMVEYGLLVALIAVVAAAGVTLLGKEIDATFDDICKKLNADVVCTK